MSTCATDARACLATLASASDTTKVEGDLESLREPLLNRTPREHPEGRLEPSFREDRVMDTASHLPESSSASLSPSVR